MPLTRAEVAALIDHTLLKPEATPADVQALCADAIGLGVLAVCVSPSLVPVAKAALRGSPVRLACVVGFPSGAHHLSVKAAEARLAVDQGVDEVDMVIDLGRAKYGDWAAVQADIEAVRRAAPEPVLLKVIIESAALTDDEIRAACASAVAAGTDFVKTSTGFHPSGGATLEAVRLMRATVGEEIGVKASGGVRSAEAAVAMVEAGANRIGTSSSAAILAGLPA